MKDFGVGLRTVATFARSANVTIEETTTLLAKLADAGLTPFRASIALRQLIQQLQSPVRAGWADELDRMGISLRDIDPKVVGLTNAIGFLQDKIKEFGSDADNVFTLRASQAFQILARQGTASLKAYQDSITDTTMAQELADRQMDTLHGSIRRLASVFEELQIAIGTSLTPTLRFFTDTLAGGVAGVHITQSGRPKVYITTCFSRYYYRCPHQFYDTSQDRVGVFR